MKASLFSFFCMLMAFATQATLLPSFQSIPSQDTGAIAFYIDPLGAQYVQHGNGKVVKTSARGDSTAVFNQSNRLGPLHGLVVRNPWKTLLLYKNYGYLVTVDAYLEPISTISLKTKNILSASAVAPSYDNQLWVFDDHEYRLKKINDRGELLMQSEDFRLLFDNSPVPTKMIDANGRIYLYDAKKGLFVFDSFGKWIRTVPVTGWLDFDIAQEEVWGCGPDSLFLYKHPLPLVRGVALPAGLASAPFKNISYPYIYLFHPPQQVKRYPMQEVFQGQDR